MNKTKFKFEISDSSGHSYRVYCEEINEPYSQIKSQETQFVKDSSNVKSSKAEFAYYITMKTDSEMETIRYIHSKPNDITFEGLKITLVPYFVYRPLEKINFIGVLFENEDNTALLGGIEINTNRLWMNPKLDQNQQLILSALSVALINIPRHSIVD
jgi:hypothetical protein